MSANTRRWVLVPVIALLTLVLGSPHAAAAGYEIREANSDGPGMGDCYDGNQLDTGPSAQICFKEFGDRFIVRRFSPSVLAQYWLGAVWRAPASNRQGICRWDGSGDAQCNYQFYENSMIYFRMAMCWKYENGDRQDCTRIGNWDSMTREIGRLNDH